MADWQALTHALDRWAAAGRRAKFWLRDDDAIEPTVALDRLLALTAADAVPLALAVIPKPTDRRLAARLEGEQNVTVVAHGWRHANHAPPSEKKQEFGAHRPLPAMLAEIAEGHARLRDLHGRRFLPLFVPPWNRIDPRLAARLPEAGFRLLSTFGGKALPGIVSIDSTVDVMDWRGTRGGREHGALVGDIVADLDRAFASGDGAVGLLTHHLVHDETVWRFLERLLAATRAHPGCRWVSASELALGLGVGDDRDDGAGRGSA